MKIGFKTASISLLLIGGTIGASADPGQHQSWRDATRSFQLAPMTEQRQPPGNGQQEEKAERRRERDAEPLSSGAQGAQGNGASNGGQEESRRPARMTPEERRALRRQINEAGRDIYTPGR